MLSLWMAENKIIIQGQKGEEVDLFRPLAEKVILEEKTTLLIIPSEKIKNLPMTKSQKEIIIDDFVEEEFTEKEIPLISEKTEKENAPVLKKKDYKSEYNKNPLRFIKLLSEQGLSSVDSFCSLPKHIQDKILEQL